MPEKTAATSPRITDLTRRLQKDPGSRVFFELAREQHAAGSLQEAARVCRDGLKKHPAYHSARVLLGRVLIDLKEFGQASRELEIVVRHAPDNLLAIRLLGEALAGANERASALETFQKLLSLNPGDEETLERIRQIESEAAVVEALSRTGAGEVGIDTLKAPAAGVTVGEGETAAPEAPSVEAKVSGFQPRPEPLPADSRVMEAGPGPQAAGSPHAAVEPEPALAPTQIGSPAAVSPEAVSEAAATVLMKPVSFGEPPVAAEPDTGMEPPAPSEGAATVLMKPSSLLEAMAARRAGAAAEPQPQADQAPSQAVEPPAALISDALPEGAATVLMKPISFETPPAPPPGHSAEEPRLRESAPEQRPETAAHEEERTISALPTPTLAEIYLAQGLPERALEVYRKVLEGDPNNHEVAERVRELSEEVAPAGSPARKKINALEGWMRKIRRSRHVQDDAGRGGPEAPGV